LMVGVAVETLEPHLRFLARVFVEEDMELMDHKWNRTGYRLEKSR
jgi:hypothetical protein